MERVAHALPAPGPWVEYEIACREAYIIWSAYEQAPRGTPWKYAVLDAWYAKCRAIDVLFDTAWAADRRSA